MSLITKHIRGLLLAVCLVGASSTESLAGTLFAMPQSETAALNSTIQVAVGFSGFGNGNTLRSYDLTVNYDGQHLSYQGASVGDPSLGDQLNLEHDNDVAPKMTPGVGSLNISETSTDEPATLLETQAANFVIVTLTFQAIAPGAAPVSVTINDLKDANNHPVEVETTFGQVNIQ